MIKYEVSIKDNKIWFKPLLAVAPQVADIGFRWDKNEKIWCAPVAYINMMSLIEMFNKDSISFDRDSQILINTEWGFINKALVRSDIRPPEKALDFQAEAMDFLWSSPRQGSLLCLSPGLGKTFTAINAAFLDNYKNVLIVTPLILLGTWAEEALKWCGIKVNWCYQSPPQEGFTVTNYDTLVSKIDDYRAKSYDLIIFDESITLKNKSTKTLKEIKEIEATKTRRRKVTRWQAAFMTRKQAKKCWMLSGSPTSKFANDLFGQLHILDPKVFSSYWRFANRYCHIHTDQWGSKIVGTREDRDIQSDLRDYMFVRNKKDVLNLPETYYEIYYVDIAGQQLKAYNDMLDTYIAELEGTDRQIATTSALGQLVKLYQIVSGLSNFEGWPDQSAKSDLLIELIKNESFETPCIIWCHYRDNMVSLRERIRETGHTAEIIRGGTKNPQEIIDKFKRNELEYLVISLETGKHGLTFTNAKTMIYYEVNTNADAYLQAGERIARIGLEHNPLCIRLHARGTVEDKMVDNLTNKLFTTATVSSYDYMQLLKGLKKNEQ